MNKKKILICDDDSTMAQNWKKQLDALTSVKREFVVEPLKKKDFEKCISQLEQRRLRARKKPGKSEIEDSIEFDETDILILDYDLLNPKAENSEAEKFIEGETVAYLARCYSRCGLIVALNQFGVNSFDLTLKGHSEFYADLNLGGKQISNKGLWSAMRTDFRSWSWPILPRACEALKQHAKELATTTNINEPILSFLGFPDEVARILPRSTIEFIGGRENPEETTFKEFVENSGNGLRGKDKPLNDDFVARIAAARIAKWLERLVMPGQDILIDAPHLISRYPSLLQEKDRRKRGSWDKTSSFDVLNLGILQDDNISAFRFEKDNWLSRPAWFWNKLSSFNKIDEVAKPWSIDRPDWVFCEDISRFLPRDEAREFVADLPSPYVRRFAKVVSGVDYTPQVRFSL